MKQLFLTADAHSTAHDIPNHIDLSKGNKLVFIDTASEPEKNGDISWLINDRKALVKAGFEVEDYTITDKTKEELIDHLPIFDFIYCSGGHTAHLLRQSYKSGFIDVVKDLVEKQEKTYIGTSAGSIITGPNLPAYYHHKTYEEENGKPAFNLVNFTVIPHWGSESFKKDYLGERLKMVYNEEQVPFVLLANTQYIHVKDDFHRIIDLGK